jgi:hypothetical protein
MSSSRIARVIARTAASKGWWPGDMAGILIAVVAYRTCTVGQTMDCEVCNGHQPLEAAVRAMTLAILDEDIVMKEYDMRPPR